MRNNLAIASTLAVGLTALAFWTQCRTRLGSSGDLREAAVQRPFAQAADALTALRKQRLTGAQQPMRIGRFEVGFGGEKEGSSGAIYRAYGYSPAYFAHITRRIGRACEQTRGNGARTGEGNSLKDPVQTHTAQILSTLSADDSYSPQALRAAAIDGETKSLWLRSFQELAENLQNCQMEQAQDVAERLQGSLRRLSTSWLSLLKPSARKTVIDTERGPLSGDSHSLLLAFSGNRQPMLPEAAQWIENLSSERDGKKWEINLAPTWSLGAFEERIRNVNQLLSGPTKTDSTDYNPAHIWLSMDLLGTNRSGLEQYLLGLRFWLYTEGIRLKTNILDSTYNQLLGDSGPRQPTGSFHYPLRSLTAKSTLRFEERKFTQRLPEGYDTNVSGLEIRTGVKTEFRRFRVLSQFLARMAANDWTSSAGGADLFYVPTEPDKLGLTAHDWTQEAGAVQSCLKVLQPRAQISPDGWNPAGRPARPEQVQGLLPLFNWSTLRAVPEAVSSILHTTQRTFFDKCQALPAGSGRRQLEALMSEWLIYSGLSHLLTSDLDITLSKETEAGSWTQAPSGFGGAAAEWASAFPIELWIPGQLPWDRAVSSSVEGHRLRLTGESDTWGLRREDTLRFLEAAGQQLQKPHGGAELENPQNTRAETSPLPFPSAAIEMNVAIPSAQGPQMNLVWLGRRPLDQPEPGANAGREAVSGGKIFFGPLPLKSSSGAPSDAIGQTFATLKKLGFTANPETGGGHVSLPFSALEQNPKALARLIVIVQEHSAIISTLFQSPARHVTSERLERPKMIEELRTFNGGTHDLLQLLYHHRYFNPRSKRRVWETQLDLSTILNRVAPEKIVTETPAELERKTWAPRFPPLSLRSQMVLRFFDAPQSAAELFLQVKFTRALLALSADTTEIHQSSAGTTDPFALARDPQRLEQAFSSLMDLLRLDPAEFEFLLWRGASAARDAELGSTFLRPEDELKGYPSSDRW